MVHNVGSGAVPVNWTDAVYLSKSQTLDATAVPIATYDGGGSRQLLDAGSSQAVPLAFNLPFDQTQIAGDYYLIVQTDSKSVLTEGAGAVVSRRVPDRFT